MVYVWSVNTKGQGRRSGWIKLTDLTPATSIKNILEDNKEKRMEILEDGGINSAIYDEYKVVSAFLPSDIEEYYLVPNRSSSYTAGKARFYYTVEEDNGNYISGIKNIPETSRQRYGVAHNNIPLDSKFYKDRNYPTTKVNIYPPSSSRAESHQLEFVWGYTITSAGEKIYSFINRRTLVSTGNNDVGGNDIKNIAPDGDESQSSTAFGGVASRANDKNTNGKYFSNSVTHTKNERRPHWQVEWDDDYEIDEIKIYNRTDCCANRLSNFKVFVLDGSNVTFSKTYTGEAGSFLSVNTNGAKGDRVKIRLNGTSALSLAKVEVYGSRVDGRSTTTDYSFLDAKKEAGRKVALSWMVDNLSTISKYEIEHNNGNGDYKLLETVSVDQNAAAFGVYNFLHNNPDNGLNTYRVKVFFANGNEAYLPTRTVTFDPTEQVIAFLNPTEGDLFIDLSDYKDNAVDVLITDFSGEVRLTKNLEKNHEEIINLNISSFKNGLYMLYIKGENQKAVAQKISLISTY